MPKRKKETGANFASELGLSSGPDIGEDIEEDTDDIGDITTYNEGIPIAYENIKKNGLNPSGLSQTITRLDLDHQYAHEAQISERMNYIIENYRSPPPYPGNASVDNPGKSMIQQLLLEKTNKQIKDNASMINYCQVDAPKNISVEHLTNIMRASTASQSVISPQMRASVADNSSGPASFKDSSSAGATSASPRCDSGHTLKDDKLVMRTLRSPRGAGTLRQIPFSLGALMSNSAHGVEIYDSATTDPSEIYPRDYDYDDDSGDGVVDLKVKEDTPDSRKISIENTSGSEGVSHDQFVPHEISNDTIIRNGSNRTYNVDIVPTYVGNEAHQESFVPPFVDRAGKFFQLEILA